MSTKEKVMNDLLNCKVDNQVYDITFNKNTPNGGTVTYESINGGASFEGNFGLSIDEGTGDVLITLTIPGVTFGMLKDGKLVYNRFLVINEDSFYNIMEHQFISLIGS